MMAAGAVPPLDALLKSDKPGVQEQAGKALHVLAIGSEQNQDAMIAAGAVPLLVALLRSDKPAVQERAAGALEHLAYGVQKNTDAIISAGAVPPLIALLMSDKPAVQEPAASALWCLTFYSQRHRNAIFAAGAVPPLVTLLRSDKPAVLAEAAVTLGCLASGTHDALGYLANGARKIQNAIIAAGAVPLLANLLRSDEPAVLEAAAGSLLNLAHGSRQNRDVIMPLLVPLYRSEEPDVQGLARRCACLHGMALNRTRMLSLQQELCLCLLPSRTQTTHGTCVADALNQFANGAQQKQDAAGCIIS